MLIFTSFYDRIIDDYRYFCQLLMDLWGDLIFYFVTVKLAIAGMCSIKDYPDGLILLYCR